MQKKMIRSGFQELMIDVEMCASICMRGESPMTFQEHAELVDFWETIVIPNLTPEAKRRYEYRQEHKDE